MSATATRLRDERSSTKLFILCWVIYAAAYLGRLNYSAALASIIDEGVFSKPNAGLIGTLFFLCYGCGQLVSGVFADRVSPFKMIFAGMSLSALANLAMALWKNYIFMAAAWGINGIAQSMLWSPILYIITNVLHERMSYRASVLIAASSPVGTLLAYLFAALCANYNWQYVFIISSFTLAFFTVVWVVGTSGFSNSQRSFANPAKVSQPEIDAINEDANILINSPPPEEKTGEIPCDLQEVDINTQNNQLQASQTQHKKRGSRLTSSDFIRVFFFSGTALFILPVMMHGMLKEGIVTWIPTMISETYNSPPSFSIFVSMVLPVINLLGVVIAMFVYERIVRKNEFAGSLLILLVTTIPLAALLFIGRINLIAAVLLLATVTTFMHSFNMYAITLVPMRFGKIGRTATVTGLLNSITYIGSALSSFIFGAVSEDYGWRNTVILWIVIAVAAAVLCLAVLGRWRNFIRNGNSAANLE